MVSPIIVGLRRPFSIMFPTKGRSRPNSTTDACTFFHSFLSQDLKRLEQSLAGDASVSLRWSTEAMSLLKQMQIQLIVLLKQCKLQDATASIFQGSLDSDWLDEYMHETAALLDFCNSLKSAISGINRYRMVIDLTVHKLAQGNLMIDLIDLDLDHVDKEVMVVSETIEFKAGFSGKKGANIDAVMVAARCTMMVISVILVSAMVSPISIHVKTDEVVHKYPQLKNFMQTLTGLITKFQEKFNGSKFMVAEHEKVDTVVGGLRGIKNTKEDIDTDLLRTSSDELKEGIQMFDAVVDEVFDVVVKGRNELLGAIREGILAVS